MNIDKDAILFEHFPTIVTPMFKPLPKLAKQQRFVMAKLGNFLQIQNAWIKATLLVWESPRNLPYGNLQQSIKVTSSIPTSFIQQMKKDAVKEAPNEFAAAVYFNRITKQTRYQQLESTSAGPSHINYIHSNNEDEDIVMDIHSHGYGEVFFSGIDDHDDQGGIKVSIVLGRCENTHLMTVAVRLCAEGFFFENRLTKDIKNRIEECEL